MTFMIYLSSIDRFVKKANDIFADYTTTIETLGPSHQMAFWKSVLR